MTHGLYLVSGSRNYRGHEPGTRFTAKIERLAEQRAIARGDIQLLERLVPSLPPHFDFPEGWLSAHVTRQPRRREASLS